MKLKKQIKILLGVTCITLLGITLFLFRENHYDLNYKVNGYEIKESYRKDNVYTFEVSMDNLIYRLSIFNDKNIKKKVISDIKKYKDEEYTCLYYVSKYIETYPICTNNDKQYITHSLIKTPEFKKFYQSQKRQLLNQNYENIKITSLDENVLIWNYKGYHYLKKDGTHKTINFLKNETYYNEKSFQIDEYILTPNYDDKYEFTTFYIIDMTNGKLSTWDTEIKLSYNYYIAGTKDGKAYLIDRKNKKEYAITPDKQKIEDITKNNYGKIWTGEWDEISIVKLINQEYKFDYQYYKEFIIESGYLYSINTETQAKTILSNQKIDQIITFKNDKVYYLSEDNLYYFCPHYGETLIASHSEWNFNDLNQIFIY